MFIEKATRFSRLLLGKFGSRVHRSIGGGTRPGNLIVVPRLENFGGGRRVLLMSRRLEDGLMSAYGTMASASRDGGSQYLLWLNGDQDLSASVDRVAGELGVSSVRCEGIREGDQDKILSLMESFEPEIVILPSPLEDPGAFETIFGLPGDSSLGEHLEVLLLSELRAPLLPDILVDVTETLGVKERLAGGGDALELSLALNQYRSATNMRGRGFAEGFHSLSPGCLTDLKNGGWHSLEALETGPIPFYRGFEAFAGSERATWKDSSGAQKVLILSPHFDDESIGCGGTILRHVDSGDRVTVLFMTDGSEGCPEEDNRDLASAIRKSEAEAAADVLGVDRLEFLDEPETMLMIGARLLKKMKKMIDETDPDVIYLPSFLDNHIDHVELNRILYATLKGTSTSPEIRLFGLWTIIPPNLIVDITASIDRKIAAVNKYRSQIVQVDYLSVTLALNRYWSVRYGDKRGYLEVFYSAGRDEYLDLIETLHVI